MNRITLNLENLELNLFTYYIKFNSENIKLRRD